MLTNDYSGTEWSLAYFTVGIGYVNKRLCITMANDACIKGDTVFAITIKKQIRLQELALENSIPIIYLVDSGGAFLPLQVYSKDYLLLYLNSVL